MDLSYFWQIINITAIWINQHGGRIILILLLALVFNFLIQHFLSVQRFIPNILDNIPQPKYKNIITSAQKRRIETLIKAAKDTLSLVIFIVAALMILPEFGIDIGPILAGLGLAGLALSMAAKDLITDFIAGIIIIIEGEINIGDKVKIGDNIGKVLAITLRRIILQGSDSSIYIIPNREVKTIRRYSQKEKLLKIKGLSLKYSK